LARRLDAASEVLRDIDYVVALGMCIAGKEWEIIATVSRLGIALESAVFVRGRAERSP